MTALSDGVKHLVYFKQQLLKKAVLMSINSICFCSSLQWLMIGRNKSAANFSENDTVKACYSKSNMLTWIKTEMEHKGKLRSRRTS